MTASSDAVTLPMPRQTAWSEVRKRLQQKPGEWELVAEDVNISMGAYLRRNYGLEVRMDPKGSGSSHSRVGRLFARYPEPESESAERQAARVVLEKGTLLAHEMRESPRAEARDFDEEIIELEQALDALRIAFQIKE